MIELIQYILIIFPLAWELYSLHNYDSISLFYKRHYETVNALNEDIESENIKRLSEKNLNDYMIYSYINLCYLISLIIGLFYTQRLFCVILLVLGLLPKSKMGSKWLLIDSLLSIVLILGMVLNRFYFHFDMSIIENYIMNFTI